MELGKTNLLMYFEYISGKKKTEGIQQLDHNNVYDIVYSIHIYKIYTCITFIKLS